MTQYGPNKIGVIFRGGSKDNQMVDMRLPLQEVWLIPVLPDLNVLFTVAKRRAPSPPLHERYRLQMRHTNGQVSAMWYELER